VCGTRTPGFLADEIFGGRQFHVCRIAFKCRHRQSRPFRKRRVVGEIKAALAGGAAMGIEYHVKAKGLWRLRDPQPCAIRRRLDVAALARQLDRIGDRYRRDGGTGAAGGGDGARNHRRRHEGAGGVVDQDDIGLGIRQRFKPGMHRGLARCAAMGRRLMPQAGSGFGEQRVVIGVHDRLHGEDIRMPAERRHGAMDHRLPADRPVLLRPARAGTKPTPGGDKDGCGSLRFGHVLMTDESGFRKTRRVRWRTALTTLDAQKQSVCQ
jgi:hypothetical protein